MCTDSLNEQWSFIKRFVCNNCLAVRSNVTEANQLIDCHHLTPQGVMYKYALMPKMLNLKFPEEPTCCIHAIEEHLLEWIQEMNEIGDHLSVSEVCYCALLSMQELNGEPFYVEDWFQEYAEKNSSILNYLTQEEKPAGGPTYHAALGQHENTFKAIVSLVASLGIHMRKADLTTLALNCKDTLHWQTAFPYQSPGLSWCRRFVTRYPEVSRHLYLQNRIASFTQIDGIALINSLRPFIDSGRTSLNDVERHYVYSQLPFLSKSQTHTDDIHREDDDTADVPEIGSGAALDPSAHGNSQYSSPNKIVRNAIIEDVLNIMCKKNVCTRRDEMRLVVKIIADIFGWKTVYENNLPSKSWTLRFMSERPTIKDHLEKYKCISNVAKLDANAFQEAVLQALEESKHAQTHYPEYYTPVESN
ncbi:hypothetical protein GJ496_004108 [Pomphorhynchus laevis]|nr:hypothetical protein GJ496_004108 [Pomphorhynchus laevis]